MRLHFYEVKTAREADAFGDRVLDAFTQGAFQMVEWTLVIATLFYFGIQTESGLFNALGWGLFMLMALRNQAFFSRKLDIQFWPAPLTTGKWWFTFLVHMAVGVSCSLGSLFIASGMAKTLSNSSLL